jgi:hypothetical protein
MNPTRAAAILALIVTIGAAGFLIYQATAVQSKYSADLLERDSCEVKRQAVVSNWEVIESHIDLLNTQGKYREAIAFEKKHADERPLFIGNCGQFFDIQPPIYAWPAGITLVGLITSLALFGAAKPRT